MAKILITIGIILVVFGLLWPYIEKSSLGHLPGDVIIKRGNFTFYFPLMTGIIISAVLSLVLWIINR